MNLRPTFEHAPPCIGYHDMDISCKQAEAFRKQERDKLFHCSISPTKTHSFSGGTSCDYNCGRYLQELVPDQNIGE